MSETTTTSKLLASIKEFWEYDLETALCAFSCALMGGVAGAVMAFGLPILIFGAIVLLLPLWVWLYRELEDHRPWTWTWWVISRIPVFAPAIGYLTAFHYLTGTVRSMLVV